MIDIGITDVAFWVGLAGVVIGALGLLLLFLFPEKQGAKPTALDQRVTTHDQTGGTTAHKVTVLETE